MADGTQIGGAQPSTLSRIQSALMAARQRQDQVATDVEAMADALCGSLGVGNAKAADNSLPPQPPGAVNAIDALVTGLSMPADRIEAALARIRGAIG